MKFSGSVLAVLALVISACSSQEPQSLPCYPVAAEQGSALGDASGAPTSFRFAASCDLACQAAALDAAAEWNTVLLPEYWLTCDDTAGRWTIRVKDLRAIGLSCGGSVDRNQFVLTLSAHHRGPQRRAVLMHELGHVAGLDHIAVADEGVMHPDLRVTLISKADGAECRRVARCSAESL